MTRVPPELKALMRQAPALTLAAAESMTCGRVQARVGEISGASDFFRGGITAYSLAQKVRHLGVNRAAAKKVNSVSAEVAEQMARGVCELFGSDLGVATTGYAERSPADGPAPDEGVAEPFAWWAIAHRASGGFAALTAGRRRAGGKFVAMRSGRVECPGATRIDAQAFVADAVLAELVAYLRELRG